MKERRIQLSKGETRAGELPPGMRKGQSMAIEYRNGVSAWPSLQMPSTPPQQDYKYYVILQPTPWANYGNCEVLFPILPICQLGCQHQ